MRIDVVKAKIVEYLNENGSAIVSDVYRYVGCGKETFYRALNELIREGVIEDSRRGKYRVIFLKNVVPSYVKVIAIITIFVVILSVVPYSDGGAFEINMDSGVKVVPYPDKSFFYLVMIYLLGVWTGVIVLKPEDLRPIVDNVYSLIRKVYSAVKNVRPF